MIIPIEIFRTEEDGQVVMLHHVRGVGEEEVGVGLQVDDAAIDEELAIAVHEVGGREALARILHLGVGEGEPYLLYLVRSEEALDDLDIGTQEGDILQTLLEGLSSSRPHACSLDVDTNEVDVRVELGELYGIFSLATAEFEHNGVVIVEILLVPMALHVKDNACHTLSFR